MCQLWALHVVRKTTVFSIYIYNFSTEFILHMYIITQTYLRFCKNKRKPYWNNTSGFDFFVNRTIGGVIMTSLKSSRWWPLTSRINFRLQFGSTHVLRRSGSLSVPNFVKISEATAELYFRFRKTNGRHIEILLPVSIFNLQSSSACHFTSAMH